MNLQTETKVGFFVLAACGAIAWLSWQSGGFAGQGLGNNMRALSSVFESVDGLNIGSKVKVAGVQVGEVIEIDLNPDATATVTFAVRENVRLSQNVMATVASSGIIGEKFVALTTDFGASEEPLSSDVVMIPSKESGSVDDMANNFARISADLEEVTSSLRSALGGRENAEKLSNIVDSLNNIGTKLEDVLTNEIKSGQIEKIVDNFAAFSEAVGENGGTLIADLKDASASLKKILSSNEDRATDLIANLNVTAANLAKITTRIEAGQGTVGRLLQDDGKAVEDLEIAMANLREVSEKVNSDAGTVGKLINDPTIADKVENALDTLGGVGNRLNSFRTQVDFYGYGLAGEDVAKGRFELTLQPRPTRYYLLGVTSDGFATESSDARTDTAFRGQEFGDDMKITVQFGHKFEQLALNQDVGFRIGLRDSTFGLGTDHAFWGNFVEINTDLYDFSGENMGNNDGNPHLDVTARVHLIDRTLYAVGGYDNILTPEIGAAFVGLGFRFQDDDLKYFIGQAL